MKENAKHLIWATALVLAVLILASSNRYVPRENFSEVSACFDRWTGQGWFVSGDEWYRVDEPLPSR